MVLARAEDRLDPQLTRDLSFSDLKMARRRTAQLLVFVVLNGAVLLLGWYVGERWWRLALFASTVATFGVNRLTRDTRDILARSDDPSDTRLPSERAKIRRLRAWFLGVVAIQGIGVLTLSVRQSDGAGLLASAAPATVEVVDVTMVPTSLDFQWPVTVDVTGGRVSQIGPYDASRARRVQNFRSFEAKGKFLVAIDASRPNWLDQVNGRTPVIDIGTAGDFVVLDRDPRTNTITRDQISAAVIGGQYRSREELRASAK